MASRSKRYRTLLLSQKCFFKTTFNLQYECKLLKAKFDLLKAGHFYSCQELWRQLLLNHIFIRPREIVIHVPFGTVYLKMDFDERMAGCISGTYSFTHFWALKLRKQAFMHIKFKNHCCPIFLQWCLWAIVVIQGLSL